MTYEHLQQQRDNAETPWDDTGDGLPREGFCPYCGERLWYCGPIVMTGGTAELHTESGCSNCQDYDSTESEAENRRQWLAMDADRQKGERAENGKGEY